MPPFMFPVSGGGRPDLELSAVMNFLDIFYLPLRKRVAASRFEEVKTRVAGSVLDFTGRVRSAFYSYEANEQMLELRQTIVQALAASFEIARRLHNAGNITDLDFARERALLESGKLALRSAEVQVRQRREELNILMGLWGAQTDWQSQGRLPEIPDQPMPDGRYRTACAQAKLGSFGGSSTNRDCGRSIGVYQMDHTSAGNRCRPERRATGRFMGSRPEAGVSSAFI